MEHEKIAGLRIKLLREERGLTQEQVAVDLSRLYGTSINKGMISKWERGLHLPSWSQIVTMAKYYDESLDFIAGLSNYRKSRR